MIAQLSKTRPSLNLTLLDFQIPGSFRFQLLGQRRSPLNDSLQFLDAGFNGLGAERVQNDLIVLLEDLNSRPFLDAVLTSQCGGDDDLPLLRSTSFGSFYHIQKV